MDTGTANEIRNLWVKLENKVPSSVKGVIGFDGFIDEVVHVVDKRIDPKNYTRVLTLKDYGQRIVATSGLSSNVEIVTVSKKLGGNGPIMANALIKFGMKMSYVGAIGYPETNAVFKSIVERCENVYPVSDPSSTDAMEFEDGKIIRTKLSPFQELNFESIKQRVGLDVLASLLDECSLIGFEDWTLPPYSGEIWKGIYNEVLPILKNNTKGKILFFDLADPASRREEEVCDALQTISLYSKHYNVILGLNLREAVQIANILGGGFGYSEYDLKKLAEFIKGYINVNMLVIHPLKESCCLKDRVFCERSGPYCEKPKLTTGAGDNFNAGFLMGIALGASPEESLLLGMAASGFYVRNARSAGFEEIKRFLLLWANGKID